jgi:hypothetical protein
LLRVEAELPLACFWRPDANPPENDGGLRFDPLMKAQPRFDDCYRSLLQKAVRRGHVEWVYTVSALIEGQAIHTEAWFEKRAAFIVFGDCWPLGAEILFNRKFHSKVAALIRATQAVKYRDATGLGFLAYALAQGDATVLTHEPADRIIRLIAKAVRQPTDFWEWICSQAVDPPRAALIANARRFRDGGRPHDGAVVKAAACLALEDALPCPEQAAAPESAFPYWVIFDRHTSEGKRVLRDLARDLHLSLPQLEWSYYFFEGSVANAEHPSPWWRRYCRWNFNRLGLDPEEARLLWAPVQAQIMEALSEESHRLQNDLYRWKLANAERIDALKRHVELFIARINEVPREQPSLF